MDSRLNILPTEDEIEGRLNNYQGITKNFRIDKSEYTRFALLGLMFGIISFIYSFMRILKDNYVMSRQEPNCISCIKIFYIMPLSFIIVIFINYLLSKRSISKIFSIFCLSFMGLFFLLGTFVMFEDQIMFDTTVIETKLATASFETRGLGFLKYILLTINQPLATTVYIVAELWGSLILSYLFLSYLNELCTERQHSRFIPPLFIIANLSLLLSALVTTGFFEIKKRLTNEQNTIFMGMIFFLEGTLVIAMLFCKYILETKIITKPIFITTQKKVSKGAKASIGFKEGIQIMIKSKFLLAMCWIVCVYSVIYNILETIFKNGIKTGADFQNVERGSYSGRFNNIDQYVTSLSVIILNLSSFSNLVDRRGWFLVAMITPVVFIISSVCILGLGSYNSAAEDSSFSLLNKIFGGNMPYSALENYLGTLCLASMKIFKYSAFDVTKERISMKIEGKYRPKFKSIYDGIFNKFGKSLGSVYCILLSSTFGSIDIRGSSPLTSLFVGICLFGWILSITYLSGSFNASVKTGDPINLDLVESDSAELEEKNEETKQEIKEPVKSK